MIEDYPEDVRGHSCLILGRGNHDRPIHVVCSPKDGYLAIESLIEFEPPDFVDTDDTNGVWEMNATYIVTT